jgi:hypothetical protein
MKINVKYIQKVYFDIIWGIFILSCDISDPFGAQQRFVWLLSSSQSPTKRKYQYKRFTNDWSSSILQSDQNLVDIFWFVISDTNS